MTREFIFSGTIPANLLPFREDYAIDEPDYRRHLAGLADTEGVTAIVCNGHAAEVASLVRDERRRALAIAVDEVGARCPLICGIYTDNTFEAADLARDAKAEGAAGMLVFPPSPFMWGAQLRPEMVLGHYAPIADAVELPIVVFQYPLDSGMGYHPETLVRLVEEIPTVVAVKDWSNDMVPLERNLRALRGCSRPVAHLSSYTLSLLGSYLLGSDGSISGMGSVTADLQAELFAAVQRGDLAAARAVNDRLDPLVRVFYAPPFVDMHNRMKEALVLLGRISRCVVRPPLHRVSGAEREAIRGALIEVGLLAPEPRLRATS